MEIIAKEIEMSKLVVFNFSLYITKEVEETEKQQSYINYNRPNLNIKIREISYYNNNSIVFVCGPMSLVNSCSDITKSFGVDFRHETFEL